ncbi:MAG TPA: hypothetical protein VK120_02970 [Sporosarcina sp.]|nr:hypothetical protein [Sporosarcina sp.]
MKKKILGSILGVLFIPFVLGSAPANAEEINIDTGRDQPTITIYDKNGHLVQPDEKQTNGSLPSLLGAYHPTSIKYLSNTATYQSNEFSGSGRRYSGYTFKAQNGTGTFKLTFKKGGFGVNTHTWGGTPADVSESYNLPLSGSPYTLTTKGFFYFLVDNPNPGQTYHIRAIK